MKRFAFSLEQVLAWRRMQARIEGLRREQLRGELRAIEIERENVGAERAHSDAALRRAGSATGADLTALDRFRVHADAEQLRLRQKQADCEKRIAAQAAILAAKERDVKVLEHLREGKLQIWTAQMDRETERVASEAFLSRWHLQASTRVNPARVK
jgi:flagellar export protein FliJ